MLPDGRERMGQAPPNELGTGARNAVREDVVLLKESPWQEDRDTNQRHESLRSNHSRLYLPANYRGRGLSPPETPHPGPIGP